MKARFGAKLALVSVDALLSCFPDKIFNNLLYLVPLNNWGRHGTVSVSDLMTRIIPSVNAIHQQHWYKTLLEEVLVEYI